MFNYQLYPGRKREIVEFKNNNKPKITIVTAYYNGHKYIDETINSVLNQTFPCWEWIIVNDGSTQEESLNKLKEIEKIDNRIKIVSNKNSGPSVTRDYGAKLASESSDYLFFLDDDDVINKTYLECAYWTLQTNKDASWAYADVLNFQGMEYKWIKYFDSEMEKKENLLVLTALIRKKDFWEVNGFELKEKAVSEDWNLWLKLLAKGKKPVRMNFEGFWYRRKESGSELQRAAGNKQRALEIIEQTRKTIKEKVEAIQYPKQKYNWEEIKESVLENVKYEICDNGRVNILMIIPWMVTGGADKFNLDIIKRIDKNKFNIIVVNTQPKVNNWRQEFEEHVIVYDLTTFLHREYWVAFINNLIEQYKINLIFNTNSYIGYSMIPYLKAKYPDIPIMDYVHMEEWYNRNGGYSRDSSRIASCIDKTLVCNKNSEKILVKHFKRNEKEVDTVYIGVDEKIFNPENYNKEEILKEYNIKNEQNKYILSYICRIDLQKRPLLLVEVLRKLKEKRKDFMCLIAGDGPMLECVQEKLKKYDLIKDVVFLGNIKETGKVYKISDLTINCSIKEGLALTSYESIAMGVPVVSANVGGQAELINEEVGAVVPCLQDEREIMNFDYSENEINLYVEKIDEILNNLTKYKEKCRKRILEGFTINHMIKKMQEHFEQISQKPNVEKIEVGKKLSIVNDVCKELITKSFIITNGEYEWLCNQVNIEYFGDAEPKYNFIEECGYDYFKTPKGRIRLKIIAITKKMHIYEFVKTILRKIRKN